MKSKSSIPRSNEMIEAAYFLAKCDTPGAKKSARSKPPSELGDVTWKEAYDSFYKQLRDGRRREAFRNSLKNMRDTFDGHVASSRQGWRQAKADRPAQVLSKRNKAFFKRLERMTRNQVWSLVKPYTLPGYVTLVKRVKADISAQDAAKKDHRARTEGGKKVHISYRTERDPKLRTAALDYHGYECSVCGFDFSKAYGEWGDGYAEVHHLVLLGGRASGKRKTDPKLDLAVLCANCHRMAHRKKGTALTIAELKGKLDRSYLYDLVKDNLEN